MTVGEGRTQFHVVHAELMTGRVDESNTWYNRIEGEERRPPKRVLTDPMVNDAVLAKMIEQLTWGRRLVGEVESGQSQEKDTSAGTLLGRHQHRRARTSVDEGRRGSGRVG